MAKLKTETLTLKLVVNGDETRKKINDLETAVVNSRDSIKEMRKELTSLAKQGQTDSARYKELTAAIKSENEAIKKNTAELTQLRSKLSLNDMTMKELTERSKKLRSELNRTKPNTKEWEQLNKDLKETGARMRELGSGTKSTGGILEGLGKRVVPTFDVVSLGLKAIHAAGALIKKGLNDITTETQSFADAWSREVAAAEAVWHHFIRRIASAPGEVKLSFKEVAQLAREAADLRDELFEMENSADIQEADAAKRMQELEAIFRDTTLSVKDRQTALNEMKTLELELANNRLMIAEQNEEAAYKNFEIQTGLDKEAAKSFITNYLEAKKAGLVEEAEEYERLIAREQYLNSVVAPGAFFSKNTYQHIYDEQEKIRKKIAETSGEVKAFFDTYKQYNLGNDAATQAFAQAVSGTLRAQAAADPSAMDAKYVRLGSQLKKGAGGGSGEDAAYRRAIQAQEDRYKEELLLLKQRLADGEILEQEYQARSLALERSTITAKIAVNEAYGKSTTDLRTKLVDMDIASRKRPEEERKAAQEAERELQEVARLESQILQTRIAASNSYIERAEAQTAVENERFEKEMAQYEAKKDKLEDYDQIVETLQRQHNNNLLKIEMDRQSAELQEMETAHKLILAQIEIEGKEKMQSKKEIDRKIAAENLRFIQQQAAFLETVVSSGQIGGMSLSTEQLEQYKLKLAELRKQLLSSGDEDKGGILSGTGDASLFGVSQSDWDTFFQNLQEGTLKAADLQNAVTAVGDAAQEGFKLASQAIQLTTAKEKKALDEYKKGQDSRKKALEERYRAGLMTESQYNAEVEKMEAEMQAKEEEAELEAARRTKTMSIIESIINTALAATKALAQGGFPAGAVMAGIVTALGAAQTAMIAAQPVGYAGGGYIVRRRQDGKQYDAVYAPDKRGYVSGPTVLVGEEGGEYVIPAEALENPQIRMVADTIESARRSGRLRSLRMEAISPAMAVSGRAAGGYTTGAAAADMSGMLAELARMSDTVDRLNAILENGIEANVSMLGRHGLVNKINEYNRAKSRGNLYDRDTNQVRSSSGSRSGR